MGLYPILCVKYTIPLITPLESALTKNSPATPLESALTKTGGGGVIPGVHSGSSLLTCAGDSTWPLQRLSLRGSGGSSELRQLWDAGASDHLCEFARRGRPAHASRIARCRARASPARWSILCRSSSCCPHQKGAQARDQSRLPPAATLAGYAPTREERWRGELAATERKKSGPKGLRLHRRDQRRRKRPAAEDRRVVRRVRRGGLPFRSGRAHCPF